jgi:formylglycine-generating enzyme required for sulfatase activity
VETPEQQRRSTIRSFVTTLGDAQLDFDAVDLADMLWLAQFLERGAVSVVESPEQEEALPSKLIEVIDDQKLPTNQDGLNIYVDEAPTTKEIKSSEKATQTPKGIPFSVPAAPSLRTRLDLARSLRPLMRKVPSRNQFDLDEEATVTQIAETEVWMPVVRPRPERWLELDLVVEDSKTTVIWEQAIAELNHLVEYQGAFRTVRTWRLNARGGRVQLFPRWRDRSVHSESNNATLGNKRSHTSGELIDPTGRRLIWLVTDCTSKLWQQDCIYKTLLDWSKIQPIAVLQMFPQRLWSRTALRNGHIVRLSTNTNGLPSAELRVEGLPQRLERRSNKDLVTVPILTLEKLPLLSWAKVISGYGDSRTPGRTFDRALIRRQATQETSNYAPRLIPQRTAQERVALFRSTASKAAQQLANLMAAAPVSLPVIDLLRDAFRADFDGEVEQSDVAEVLLSGLLRRCDTENDDVCRYEFWGDDLLENADRVRYILIGDASVSKTVKVLNVLSESICLRLGIPAQSFQALIGKIQESEDEDLRNAALPFARLGLDVLRRLGGDYAALAQSYELEDVEEFKKNDKNDDFPLQPCEYESATITAILDRFDFETATITQQSRILGFGQKWRIDRKRSFTWGYTEKLIAATGEELGLDMIAIPAGSFMMGADRKTRDQELPQHKVTLQPFYLGRYPITQAQWRIVAGYEQINRKLKPNPSRFKENNNRPVENVSWPDAQEFCQRLSQQTGKIYRLPSEAEWEYACRAGTTTPFHFGETISTELANYDGTEEAYNNGPKGEYRQETTDVGAFPANEWGLYDMHGNVWERCEDLWHNNYVGAPIDGSAWLKENDNDYHLLRGGSWNNGSRNCRSASRDNGIVIYDSMGFRVCCERARILLNP